MRGGAAAWRLHAPPCGAKGAGAARGAARLGSRRLRMPAKAWFICGANPAPAWQTQNRATMQTMESTSRAKTTSPSRIPLQRQPKRPSCAGFWRSEGRPADQAHLPRDRRHRPEPPTCGADGAGGRARKKAGGLPLPFSSRPAVRVRAGRQRESGHPCPDSALLSGLSHGGHVRRCRPMPPSSPWARATSRAGAASAPSTGPWPAGRASGPHRVQRAGQEPQSCRARNLHRPPNGPCRPPPLRFGRRP